MINENPAHRLRGDAEEVSLVLPGVHALVHQPEVGLVDEGGGLQGMVGTLAPKQPRRQLAELGIDQGQELISGGGPAVGEIEQ